MKTIICLLLYTAACLFLIRFIAVYTLHNRNDDGGAEG